jgi:hypothetical protein
MTLTVLNEPATFRAVQVTYDQQFDIDTSGVPPESWQFFPQAVRAGARSVEDEKRAFLSMLPRLRRSHPEKHVVIENGMVADADESRRDLVRRFFGQPRRGPVYIGFVGERPIFKAPTPFVHRRPR